MMSMLKSVEPELRKPREDPQSKPWEGVTHRHHGKTTPQATEGAPQKAMGGTVGSHKDTIHKSRGSPKQAGEGAYQKPTGGSAKPPQPLRGWPGVVTARPGL